MLVDGGMKGQRCNKTGHKSCSLGRKCVCRNPHFWGKKNISFWSAQCLQAECGFPLMCADLLIYDNYGSVVFLTSHDV